jgi:uncharacterized protein YjbI with pentapeptide repeats
MSDAEELKRQYAAGERTFADVELYNADLSEVALDGAKLRQAGLTQVVLKRARLSHVDLTEAQLTDCSAAGASFEDVTFDKAELLTVDFTQARFRRCSFKRTSFEECSLVEAIFEDCQFNETKFTDVKLDRARLAGITFQGGHWMTCQLDGANLREARLIKLETYEIKAADVDFSLVEAPKHAFSDCKLERANFAGANLAGGAISACALAGASFREANIVGTDLSEQELAGVDLTGAKYDRKTRFPEGFDPAAAGAVLVSSARTPRKRGAMIRAEFEKRWGKPKLEAEANDALAQARVPLPKLPAAKRPPMFDGCFYNVGYYRLGSSPDSDEYDWEKLSTALELGGELAGLLQGQFESSNQDVPYFPFVLAPSVSQEATWESIEPLEALGVHPWFDEAPQDVVWQEDDIDPENAFVQRDEDDDSDVSDYYSSDALDAYKKATRWMHQQLEGTQRISLEGADKHPIFWVGRTPDGLHVGLFTLRDDT